jgi:hypothetical protein
MPPRARLALVVAVAVTVLVAVGGLLLLHQLRTGLDTARWTPPSMHERMPSCSGS